MPEHVPVIDFSKCGLGIENDSDIEQAEISSAGDKLYEAFSTSGFAYLSNHGISSEDVRGFQDAAENFFKLPQDSKMKYCTNSLDFCYDPIGSQTAHKERGYDYQEGFRMTGNAFADDKTVWPDKPADFKAKSLQFAEICKQLSLRIMKALGAGLKLKDPLHLWKCHSLLNQRGNSTTLKAIRYPPLFEDTLMENQIRLGEHTDWLCLTLLFQDDNGGLQIQNQSGEFEDVTPIPGTIILNVCDSLQFWSGGRLKSTVHRVVPPTDPEKRRKARRSIVYFISADDDVLLSEMEFQPGAPQPIKSTEGEYEPKRVGVPTVREYMDELFKKQFYVP